MNFFIDKVAMAILLIKQLPFDARLERGNSVGSIKEMFNNLPIFLPSKVKLFLSSPLSIEFVSTMLFYALFESYWWISCQAGIANFDWYTCFY